MVIQRFRDIPYHSRAIFVRAQFGHTIRGIGCARTRLRPAILFPDLTDLRGALRYQVNADDNAAFMIARSNMPTPQIPSENQHAKPDPKPAVDGLTPDRRREHRTPTFHVEVGYSSTNLNLGPRKPV